MNARGTQIKVEQVGDELIRTKEVTGTDGETQTEVTCSTGTFPKLELEDEVRGTEIVIPLRKTKA